MTAPTMESALLVAARQLADEALEHSRRPRRRAVAAGKPAPEIRYGSVASRR